MNVTSAVVLCTTGSSKQPWLQCRERLPVPERSLLVAGPLMDLPYPNQRR
jgi:hypothetical protein